MNLMLAGLDNRDIVSGRNPDLGLAALRARKPQSWQEVLGGVARENGADAGGDAEWDAAQRLRSASLTPDGREQPPEVLGVDSSARVPNSAQPMPGEFERGREVGNGRPGFFGRLMPPPTGVANGVGVPEGRSFGAPTGMPASGADRVPVEQLAGLAQAPAGAPGPATLAGLPHFAHGGFLGTGGRGVVGESGEEVITAEPGGGVMVRPVSASISADLAGLGRASRSAAQTRLAQFRAVLAGLVGKLPPDGGK